MKTVWLLGLLAGAAAAQAQVPASAIDYAADARALDQRVIDNYAYQDHWPGGRLPDSPVLAAERAAVHDRDSLLHYAENRIASLADHHAITGSSFKDSWAVVPTYADLWIVRRGDRYVVDAVKSGSPAAEAGIVKGDGVTAIADMPTVQAVAGFWQALGLDVTPERADYAARVLAAGRRDRPRVLTVAHGGQARTVTLPSLYTIHLDQPPVSVSSGAKAPSRIRINNSLGDPTTIAAFDAAMATIAPDNPVIIDLSDTPSGGNTSVARAMMGWFVRAPTSYQVHSLPAEERETGIARQWIEQVLPRAGKYHAGKVRVEVGRWTGSMGEGIAIGFRAIGAAVCGGAMAQLRGAVYDFALPSSGMVVKLPAERLATTDGIPRAAFVARACPGT
ncbi:MAG: peptidase S41 [Sphingomonas sp. 28-66-16]|nr:MAG: peptidase S41 [Sphingomonas sp. 28-66-16]